MSALNLVLLNGHIACRECLSQIPATFLVCPACAGLVRERGQWVMPAAAELLPLETEQPLLFPAKAEYPA